MKVIFLDIDGVLNSTHTRNPRGFPYVTDPDLVDRLRDVVAKTGAEVILSSTWRYDPVGILAAKYYEIPFVDMTPDLPKQSRSREILQWLGEHPLVERFAVVDDEDDDLDDLPLFQPSNKIGLDPETANGLIAYLNRQTDRDTRRSVFTRVAQNVAAAFGGHKG